MTNVEPPIEYRGAGPGKKPGATLLRVIGVFKLFKGVLLMIAAIWALRLRHEDIADVALVWARRLHIAPGNKYLEDFLEKLPALSARKLEVLAGVLGIYSAMFSVEGIGLLYLKYWAEWMTVITTAGLIPLELFELIRKPEKWKVAALVVNVAVAAYLAARVAARKHAPAG